MKMIQCSDLHLGAKMMEGLSEYQIAERSDELLKDFIAMTRYAVNNRIPVCMICGDLFDSSQPIQNWLTKFVRLLLGHLE